MTTFYLVRHGTRITRGEETFLSDIGVKQVEYTAQYLKGKKIQEIYASPANRTQQTAQIISSSVKSPIFTDIRLKERLIWGDRKGETFDELLNEWNKTSLDRNYKPQNGDSSKSAGDRFRQVLEEIEVKNRKSILIVSHGGIIGDFLRNIFSDTELPFQTDSISRARYVPILECSITEVEKNDDDYKLVRVNDTTHLSIPIV